MPALPTVAAADPPQAPFPTNGGAAPAGGTPPTTTPPLASVAIAPPSGVDGTAAPPSCNTMFMSVEGAASPSTLSTALAADEASLLAAAAGDTATSARAPVIDGSLDVVGAPLQLDAAANGVRVSKVNGAPPPPALDDALPLQPSVYGALSLPTEDAPPAAPTDDSAPATNVAPPPPPLAALPPVAYGAAPPGSIKLVSWNINGFKARAKEVLSYVATEAPDVLLLQETKLQRPHAPSRHFYLPRYHRSWAFSTAKAGYSGVAIFSLVPPLAVTRGFAAMAGGRGDADHPAHGRLLTAEFADIYVVNTYVPNSGDGLAALPYRTGMWDADLSAHLHALAARGKPVVWGGDLNVAAASMDVAGGIDARRASASAGLTDAERGNFARLLACTCAADAKDATGEGGAGGDSTAAAADGEAAAESVVAASGGVAAVAAPLTQVDADRPVNGGGAAAGHSPLAAGAAAATLATDERPASGKTSPPPGDGVALNAPVPAKAGIAAPAPAMDALSPKIPSKRRRLSNDTGGEVVPDPDPPRHPTRHCFVDTLRHLYGPVPHVYTFWSMRTAAREVNRGWRIDYWVVSGGLLPRLAAAFVRAEVGTSDHCPVGVLLRDVKL